MASPWQSDCAVCGTPRVWVAFHEVPKLTELFCTMRQGMMAVCPYDSRHGISPDYFASLELSGPPMRVVTDG